MKTKISLFLLLCHFTAFAFLPSSKYIILEKTNRKLAVKLFAPPTSLPIIRGECFANVPIATVVDDYGVTITGITSNPRTYNVPGTYFVDWAFTDSKGAIFTIKQTVIVVSSPKPVISMITTADCTSMTNTVTVTTIPASATYILRGTNPVTAPMSSTTGVFPGLAPGDYSITIITARGCMQPMGSVQVDAPFCSSLDLKKTASTNATKVGDVIDYTFVVTNTGKTPLKDVIVTDVKADPGSINPAIIPTLLAGQSVIVKAKYTLKQSDVDAGSFSNQASVEGEDPTGIIVNDPTSDDPTTPAPDDITVTVIQPLPKISLVKTATIVDNFIDYTFTIRNTGNVTLFSFLLTDAKLGINNRIINIPGGLAPNATRAVTERYTLTQADKDAGKVENTAKITAKDPKGTNVEDISGTTENNDDLTVTTFPKSPIAVDDLIKIDADQTIDIPVLANDNYAPTPVNKVTIEIIDQPQHGTVSINPDGTIKFIPEPGYMGAYTFTYRIRDEYGYYSNTVTVTIRTNYIEINIPNLFTPNNDGLNDVFKIRGTNQFIESELVIANRWGNEVYRAVNYQNNWSGDGLNEGTYYYLFKGKLYGDEWKVYKGFITLLRTIKK